MIVNFEEITYELNKTELDLVPVFIEGFKNKIGIENCVTNPQIEKRLKELGYKGISQPRIRKIIHYIRVNNLVERLIATSKGYFISNDLKELEKYVLSLRQRENSLREVRLSLVKQINKII